MDGGHGDEAYQRRLEGGGGCHVVFAGKGGPVAEVTHRLYHADNLAAAAHAVFVYFHFSFQQAHEVRRRLVFAVDDLVFLVALQCELPRQELALFLVQGRPHVGYQCRYVYVG